MERGGHFSFECASCVLGEGRVEQSGPRRHDEPGLRRIPAFAEPCRLCQVAEIKIQGFFRMIHEEAGPMTNLGSIGGAPDPTTAPEVYTGVNKLSTDQGNS